MQFLLSITFLALLALVQSKVAKVHEESNEVLPSDVHLMELQRLLQDSDLLEEKPEFDDGEDDDDDDDLGEAERFNPITWLKNKLRNKCVCENLKCECCFKLKLFKKKACLSVEQLSSEKRLKVLFKLDKNDLVNKSFDINRSDKVCGTLPAPLNFLKFCFSQDSEASSDNAIRSCSTVDFRVLGSVGAVIQFKCLEFKEGKLTFGGYSKIKKEGMFTLKAKNPFKVAVALYKARGKGKH